MKPLIFVPGVGQHENIGDVILRRQLLDRLRAFGTLHVYVGASDDHYDRALGLTSADRSYRSFKAWYVAALAATIRGRGSYAFKPGEIQLTLVGMKEHLSMLPVAALARLRHRPVLRIGTGSRNFAPLPRALMAPSIALSNLTLWRDSRTALYFSGSSMPDLAFGEGSPQTEFKTSNRRDVLIVSMRSDREATPQQWIDGVAAFASKRGLRIVAVSQVVRDNPKTEELARRLAGEAITWSGADHLGMERRLRELYRSSAVAVSDRLHVLIAAFTEGALPAALVIDGSDKIPRHFSAAGIEDITLEVGTSASGPEISAWLSRLNERRAELIARLGDARNELNEVFVQVENLFVNDESAKDMLALHVGRSGEVAGGMTQVMNEYLAWTFQNFEVQLLRSRGSVRLAGDALLILRASLRLATRRHVERTVLVVHLSQGGSFLREGWLLVLGRMLGYATVAQLHGSTFATFAKRRPRLTGLVLRKARGIHVLSEESAKVASRLAPRSSVVVIPNAVTGGAASAKSNIAVFAGSVSRRKGVDVLLKAWEQLDTTGWKLLIAGPVEEPGLVPLTGLPDVKVLGPLPHHQLMSLLERSRMAILPSRDEAMPMFLIEAMGRSNAILSTTVGGIPDLVPESAGRLVEPADADALRAALGSLLHDDAGLRTLQAGAKEVFQAHFSREVIAPRLEEFWTNVLRGSREVAR